MAVVRRIEEPLGPVGVVGIVVIDDVRDDRDSPAVALADEQLEMVAAAPGVLDRIVMTGRVAPVFAAAGKLGQGEQLDRVHAELH